MDHWRPGDLWQIGKKDGFPGGMVYWLITS